MEERFAKQLEYCKDKLHAFIQKGDEVKLIELTREEFGDYEIDYDNDFHQCSVPVLKRK
jgi:hypothetical protein